MLPAEVCFCNQIEKIINTLAVDNTGNYVALGGYVLQCLNPYSLDFRKKGVFLVKVSNPAQISVERSFFYRGPWEISLVQFNTFQTNLIAAAGLCSSLCESHVLQRRKRFYCGTLEKGHETC